MGLQSRDTMLPFLCKPLRAFYILDEQAVACILAIHAQHYCWRLENQSKPNDHVQEHE